MAKFIATTFGGALGLFGLISFASPTLFGAHGCLLGNLLHLLLGAAVVCLAWRAGPAWLFSGCVAAAAVCLAWGFAGLLLGQPARSTLAALPPDTRLWVVVPGLLECGRSDHLLHLFFGVGLAIAGVVAAAESPWRLSQRR